MLGVMSGALASGFTQANKDLNTIVKLVTSWEVGEGKNKQRKDASDAFLPQTSPLGFAKQILFDLSCGALIIINSSSTARCPNHGAVSSFNQYGVSGNRLIWLIFPSLKKLLRGYTLSYMTHFGDD